jgi:hypothetical protein
MPEASFAAVGFGMSLVLAVVLRTAEPADEMMEPMTTP